MTGTILDTNVLSEIRKKPGRIDPVVESWYDDLSDEEIFVSVISLGEIRYGAELLRERDPAQFQVFDAWQKLLSIRFDGRILPVTLATADLWGKLRALRPLPSADALIAATALEHGYTIATRNYTDFEGLGIDVFNPFPATSE